MVGFVGTWTAAFWFWIYMLAVCVMILGFSRYSLCVTLDLVFYCDFLHAVGWYFSLIVLGL